MTTILTNSETHSKSHRPLLHKKWLKTTSWLLITYSFKLRSAFSHVQLISSNMCPHPNKETHFSFCDCAVWPMTLTIKHDLEGFKVNQHDKHSGQRSISSKIIVSYWLQKDRHTHITDQCSTWTTKVVSKTLAPHGSDSRLFATDVSAKFKVTWHKN